MKTRNAGFKNYGISKDEADSLQAFCRSPQFGEHELLIDCAKRANEQIASELFYSLVRGVSYDELSKIRYIPLSRSDFYGYRRKCLAIFRGYLMVTGKSYMSKDEPINLFDRTAE